MDTPVEDNITSFDLDKAPTPPSAPTPQTTSAEIAAELDAIFAWITKNSGENVRPVTNAAKPKR